MKTKAKKKIMIKTKNGFRQFTGTCLVSRLLWSDNVEEFTEPCECETELVPTECFEEEWSLDGFDEVIRLEKHVTYGKNVTYVADDETGTLLTK